MDRVLRATTEASYLARAERWTWAHLKCVGREELTHNLQRPNQHTHCRQQFRFLLSSWLPISDVARTIPQVRTNSGQIQFAMTRSTSASVKSAFWEIAQSVRHRAWDWSSRPQARKRTRRPLIIRADLFDDRLPACSDPRGLPARQEPRRKDL